ncbi:hypothetical protein MNB_SV-12-1733 [hydrothermal vent metagenome]|uniref:Uncharacterized protein n=1 Tax=hydrothermal vent metagenome TaxID=652676 RepID=A0A1W1CF85_9ZZZZ
MNVKKVVSVLIIAIFTASSLYAGPCINCVATVVKQENINQVNKMPWGSKSLANAKNSESSFSQDEINGMIALDDNEYDSEEIEANTNEAETLHEELQDDDIVLTYDSPQIELTKTLYACEDIVNNIIACDNEKKEECECV